MIKTINTPVFTGTRFESITPNNATRPVVITNYDGNTDSFDKENLEIRSPKDEELKDVLKGKNWQYSYDAFKRIDRNYPDEKVKAKLEYWLSKAKGIKANNLTEKLNSGVEIKDPINDDKALIKVKTYPEDGIREIEITETLHKSFGTVGSIETATLEIPKVKS